MAYFLESFYDRKTISPMVDGLGNKNSVVYLREGQHFQDSRSITKREKRSQSPLCRHARLTTTMNNEDGRKRDHFPALRISFPRSEALSPDIYFLKHTCSILRQSSTLYLVQGRAKPKPWVKQHRAQPVPSWRNPIQGGLTVGICYCHALENGCLCFSLSLSLSLSLLPLAPSSPLSTLLRSLVPPMGSARSGESGHGKFAQVE